MAYELQRLAPGSYDVLRHGTVIASLVNNGGHSATTTWTVELLEEMLTVELPTPFTEPEHTFDSLGAAKNWLGIAVR
ncbi:hypothetical protein [Microvirga zambiensis]|uniref:hypothetical protein n=1 Tax=Microvirga zambiensis TaxID=1402137 RepID=UPI00191D1F2E|nr:hypothetical protein [Microvirga zambiensis]